jgi:hypothetical protein
MSVAWEIAWRLTRRTMADTAQLPESLRFDAQRSHMAFERGRAAQSAYQHALAAFRELMPETEVRPTPPKDLALFVHGELPPSTGRAAPPLRRAMVRAAVRDLLADAGSAYAQKAGETGNTTPPCTTAQLLHPKKAQRDGRPPVMPTIAKPAKLLGKREVRFDHTLGEVGWRAILSAWLGDTAGLAATSGWEGDRTWLFHDPKTQRDTFVSLVLFDNPTTAANFADTVKTWLAEPELRGGTVYLDEQRVIVMRGNTPDEAQTFVDRLWRLEFPTIVCGPTPPVEEE